MYLFIEARKGDTFLHRFQFQDTEGIPPNFTGATAKMQVRKAVGEPVLAEYSTANGKLTFGNDPTLGELWLNDPPANTTAYDWEQAVYDLQLEFPNGQRFTVFAGNIKILDEVTT